MKTGWSKTKLANEIREYNKTIRYLKSEGSMKNRNEIRQLQRVLNKLKAELEEVKAFDDEVNASIYRMRGMQKLACYKGSF